MRWHYPPIVQNRDVNWAKPLLIDGADSRCDNGPAKTMAKRIAGTIDSPTALPDNGDQLIKIEFSSGGACSLSAPECRYLSYVEAS